MKHPIKCDGCKAFYQSQSKYVCELGYKIKLAKVGSYKGADIIRPSPECGECPKPLTYEEFFNARKKER